MSDVNQISYGKNIAILVLDSCRYDTFVEGSRNTLCELGQCQRAYAPATWTLPSHISMLQGFLPESNSRKPYYNRFVRQLLRLTRDHSVLEQSRPAYFVLEGDSVFSAFANHGSRTLAVVGKSWLMHPTFANMFHTCLLEPIAEKAIYYCNEWISCHRNAALLVNFAATHFPYASPNNDIESNLLLMPVLENYKPGLSGKSDIKVNFNKLRQCQINSVKHLSSLIHGFATSLLQKNFVVVLTSDHGECFGEDGLFGHGFYHKKVMEVPLLILGVDD